MSELRSGRRISPLVCAWVFIVVAVLVCAGVLPRGSQAWDDIGIMAEPGTIRVIPSPANVTPGGTVTVDIRLEGVEDYYGIEIQLSFDPSIVQVPSMMATPRWDLFDPFNSMIVRNYVDNSAGTFLYVITNTNPGAPFSGSGRVCSLTFEGVTEGTSNLIFEHAKGSTIDAEPLWPARINGSIVVAANTPTPTDTLTITDTPTDTPTITDTPTDTPTITDTPTDTPTITDTPTDTPTITDTPTDTPTATNTPANTPTATDTPDIGPVDTPTATATSTDGVLSVTPTVTSTPTGTPTDTPTATYTPDIGPVDTPTATATGSVTASVTPIDTSTATVTATSSVGETPTDTPTPDINPVWTPTATATGEAPSGGPFLPMILLGAISQPAPTATLTPTLSLTGTPTPSSTPTSTDTPTPPPAGSFLPMILAD